MTIKDIISQDQADLILPDKFLSYEKSLCKSAGCRLYLIAEGYP